MKSLLEGDSSPREVKKATQDGFIQCALVKEHIREEDGQEGQKLTQYRTAKRYTL
jgi:hypothetical protein